MTIEMITAKLDTIAADSFYSVYEGKIYLDIDDFEGFDEEWDEVYRDLVDEEAVNAVIEWLEKNADKVTGDFYRHFYFGEIEVVLGWTSFDI